MSQAPAAPQTLRPTLMLGRTPILVRMPMPAVTPIRLIDPV